MTRPAHARAVDALFLSLNQELTPRTVSPFLEELTRVAEECARVGDWIDVVDVFTNMIAREATIHDAEVKRAFLLYFRRLAKPSILRGVAQLLPRRRELRDQLHEIFLRSGSPVRMC